MNVTTARSEVANGDWIAGFRQRTIGFLIDSVAVGGIGISLAVFLEPQFVAMGNWGPLVGFLVSMAYFGVMDSEITGGQTPGKRMMGTRVVDIDNKPITLPRSIARYAVLGVPFTLNGAVVGDGALMYVLAYPLSMIVFGGLMSATYLIIFNRVTRQSLHDLATRTFVVREGVEKQVPGEIWKPHLVIVGIMLLGTGAIPAFIGYHADNPSIVTLTAAHDALLEEEIVLRVEIFDGKSTHYGENSGSTTYVSAFVRLKVNHITDAELAARLIRKVVEAHPAAREKDALLLMLAYGFDIGIAGWSENQNYRFNPETLEELE